MLAPVARDVAVGALVHTTFLIPVRCRGAVRGEVSFHQQRGRPDQRPFAGIPNRDPRVGAFVAVIP